jgi:hypothetical protein
MIVLNPKPDERHKGNKHHGGILAFEGDSEGSHGRTHKRSSLYPGSAFGPTPGLPSGVNLKFNFMTLSVGRPSGPIPTTCGYCSPPGRRSATKSAAHAAGLEANQLSCEVLYFV